MSDKHKPCSVRDGRFVEPCSTLASVTGNAIEHRSMVHMPTGEPTRSFFILKSGEHRRRGIVLNVCPFCGERIDAPVSDKAADAA